MKTTKKQTICFVAVCYGAVLAAWLLFSIFSFGQDAVRRATGLLHTSEHDFANVECVNLTPQSATVAVSDNNDPQLIVKDIGEITEVRLAFTASEYQGEVNLYYSKNGDPFDSRYKIWGKAQNDGSYIFTLPRTKVDAVRIDPSNVSNITLTLKSLVVNAPRSFFSYFGVTYEMLFNFLIYPGLAAACIAWIWPLACKIFKKKALK